MGSSKSKNDPRVLTQDTVQLLEARTKLTREEIEEIHRNFINKYPKGKLNEREFKRDLKQCLPPYSKYEKFSEIAFKAFDSDNSGTIHEVQLDVL
ncbi:hypothetical protein ACOME3_008459 [Neoechinorhynchus agilis]